MSLLPHSNIPLLQRSEPMRKFYTLLWREVCGYFYSPIAYIVLVFFLLLWLSTLIYFWIFQTIHHQLAANSAGAFWGSYLMLLLLGMFYLSVGCLASVLTKNQIIAAIISFCAITLLFFLGLVQF